jgi:glycosyltransferase involved in cell wall biosynthesis
LSLAVRVHVVDPPAYTPAYDHALCSALEAAGAEVELFTSRFAYGPVATAEGYERHEFFYRRTPGEAGSRLQLLAKLAQHVPDMLRYRAAARAADVVHFQWLTVQHLDRHLLPAGRSPARRRRSPSAPPLVLTAHDILPREPRPGQRAAQRRAYDRFDAIVVHSEHGRKRLVDELGIEPTRVHVIAHGVLRPWEGTDGFRGGGEAQLPAELRGAPGPVVLMFGLLRPYKGLDVLLEAWRGMPRGAGGGDSGGAELWIVGMPRMNIAALLTPMPAGVRLLPRFLSDAEILAVMRRASLVVLPYRQIDQSGVALAALGAGVPLLLSDVGGFPEIAATGAAQTVPAGDPLALRAALAELLSDPAALAAMSGRAREAGAGEYSWESIARRTLALYELLLDENSSR